MFSSKYKVKAEMKLRFYDEALCTASNVSN